MASKSGLASRTRSVSMKPGRTALTRTLWARSSMAAVWVRDTTPALAAA